MLVRTSLNDSQVMYWEPAKYVAKLRTLKTDARPLLFKINLDAGHGGASGRYDHLREIAFDYAFILTQLGLAAPQPVAARVLMRAPPRPLRYAIGAENHCSRPCRVSDCGDRATVLGNGAKQWREFILTTFRRTRSSAQRRGSAPQTTFRSGTAMTLPNRIYSARKCRAWPTQKKKS